MGKRANLMYLECNFDPNFNGVALFQNHPSYKLYKEELFSKAGLAFILIDHKVIFFDGERIAEEKLNKNHILYVFAHEIGHHVLGHNSRRNYRLEMEADWAAVNICVHTKRKSAAMLAIYEFYNRYGFSYQELSVSNKKRQQLSAYLESLNI
jgi:hypothetical protein